MAHIFKLFRQEFVPGRGFALADIGYDLAGMTGALGLIWLWSHRRQVQGAFGRHKGIETAHRSGYTR